MRLLKNEAAKSLVTFENVAEGALFLMHTKLTFTNSVYLHCASTPGKEIHTIAVLTLNTTSLSNLWSPVKMRIVGDACRGCKK